MASTPDNNPFMRLSIVALLGFSSIAAAQQMVATTDVNVRSRASTASPVRGHLSAGDTISLVSATKRNGYFHIIETDSTTGWVYGRYLHAIDTTVVAVSLDTTTHVGASAPGTPGTSALQGCGDHLWRKVYHPQRLLVKQECVTVRGTIVDATNGRQHDGVRHESDGDTHGWVQLDPQYRDMLDAGNLSDEQGNLVFEIVCHYMVKQADAKPACNGFIDHTVIPPVGTHVEITGTYVQDTNHAKWNEIHPVSKIVVKP